MKTINNNFLKNNLLLKVLLFLICGIILLALFAKFLVPNDPYLVDMSLALQPSSFKFPFGTDNLGRCIFSRVLVGTTTSVISTLIIIFIISIFGTTMGVISAYAGGVLDTFIMKLTLVMQAFPGVVLAIAVAGILGPGIINVIIAISIINWTKYARLSRSFVLEIKNSNYVTSARLLGASNTKIITKHIIPNIISNMIIMAALDIGVMMLEMASLSFLGLGATPPAAEWGIMMNEGRKYMQTAPNMVIFPGIAIFVTVMIFNLLSDQLRDYLDIKS